MHSSDVNTRNDQSAVVIGDRALAAWESASVVSSILIAEWILSAATGRSRFVVAIPIALAFVLMSASHHLRSETFRDLGFRFDNFLRAGKLLLVPMVLTAGLCLVAMWWFGGEINFLRWHPGRPIAGQLALGFGWGLVQQCVLQGFINRRAQVIFGPGWLSVFLVAAVCAAASGNGTDGDNADAEPVERRLQLAGSGSLYGQAVPAECTGPVGYPNDFC